MSHGSPNLCGVAIRFKKGFDCTILSKFEDPLGSYLILKAEIKDKLNVLINIYAPNNDKHITNFLNYLRTILQNVEIWKTKKIIGGKINCPLNPALDKKKGGTMLPRKSVIETILIVYETNLIWLTFEK